MESCLMQRVSMIHLEFNEWAELFRFWQTLAFSRPSVESLRRNVLRFSSPAAEGSARRAQRSPWLCRCGSVHKESFFWLPSLCWNRDTFRDAILLVSSEEGAQALFVFFAYQTHQSAMFLPLRRFHLAPLALTRVSGNEALNA